MLEFDNLKIFPPSHVDEAEMEVKMDENAKAESLRLFKMAFDKAKKMYMEKRKLSNKEGKQVHFCI